MQVLSLQTGNVNIELKSNLTASLTKEPYARFL